jgi:hypothetical protein
VFDEFVLIHPGGLWSLVRMVRDFEYHPFFYYPCNILVIGEYFFLGAVVLSGNRVQCLFFLHCMKDEPEVPYDYFVVVFGILSCDGPTGKQYQKGRKEVSERKTFR